MIRQLFLLRHGESVDNAERRCGGHGVAPLTDRGRRQARAAAAALRDLRITALHSSDLPRALETAALVGEATGLTPIADARLRERSLGLLTGLTLADAEERHPAEFYAVRRRDPHVAIAGGETLVDMAERVRVAFAAISDGERVALVTHAGVAFALLTWLFPERRELELLRFDNGAFHWLERAADRPWRAVELNRRAHLEADR